MRRTADYPVVIVDKDQARSKPTNKALPAALEDGLEECQAPLLSTVTSRLYASRLPISQLEDPNVRATAFRRRGGIDLLHATDKATSKLILTPTRDAGISGPRLREAHHRMGLYPATEFVTESIGVEEFPIPHVNEGQAAGLCLKGEAKTLIVVLMRAGEPMASGISTAFPTAMFLHAKGPCDLTAPAHQGGQINPARGRRRQRRYRSSHVCAADSPRESRCPGDDHCRGSTSPVCQTGRRQSFSRLMWEDEKPSFVALQISENKDAGKVTVDTGSSLFNTKHLQ